MAIHGGWSITRHTSSPHTSKYLSRPCGTHKSPYFKVATVKLSTKPFLTDPQTCTWQFQAEYHKKYAIQNVKAPPNDAQVCTDARRPIRNSNVTPTNVRRLSCAVKLRWHIVSWAGLGWAVGGSGQNLHQVNEKNVEKPGCEAPNFSLLCLWGEWRELVAKDGRNVSLHQGSSTTNHLVCWNIRGMGRDEKPKSTTCPACCGKFSCRFLGTKHRRLHVSTSRS